MQKKRTPEVESKSVDENKQQLLGIDVSVGQGSTTPTSTSGTTAPTQPAPTTSSPQAVTTPEQNNTIVAIDQLMRGAYSELGSATNYKDMSGNSMPLYDGLPPAFKKGLEQVVRYVISNCPNQ